MKGRQAIIKGGHALKQTFRFVKISVRLYSTARIKPRIIHKTTINPVKVKGYTPSEENGDTNAHIRVNDIKFIANIIEENGVDEAAKQFKVKNNVGLLPIDLADPDSATYEAVSSLTIHSKKEKIIPLSDEVTIKPYLANGSDALIANLVLATEINRQILSLNIASSTRPEANHLDAGSRIALSMQVSTGSYSAHGYAVEATEIGNHDTQKRDKMIAKSAREVMKSRAANCEGYAFLTLHQLRIMNPEINADLVFIKNSDHVFAVIGRDPNSDINDITTWGPNAVVLDAWGNNVAPAFTAKLQGFEQHTVYPEYPEEKDGVVTYRADRLREMTFNILTDFNPHYNSFGLALSVRGEKEKPASGLAKFKFFTPADVKSLKESAIKVQEKTERILHYIH